MMVIFDLANLTGNSNFQDSVKKTQFLYFSFRYFIFGGSVFILRQI